MSKNPNNLLWLLLVLVAIGLLAVALACVGDIMVGPNSEAIIDQNNQNPLPTTTTVPEEPTVPTPPTVGGGTDIITTIVVVPSSIAGVNGQEWNLVVTCFDANENPVEGCTPEFTIQDESLVTLLGVAWPIVRIKLDNPGATTITFSEPNAQTVVPVQIVPASP